MLSAPCRGHQLVAARSRHAQGGARAERSLRSHSPTPESTSPLPVSADSPLQNPSGKRGHVTRSLLRRAPCSSTSWGPPCCSVWVHPPPPSAVGRWRRSRPGFVRDAAARARGRFSRSCVRVSPAAALLGPVSALGWGDRPAPGVAAPFPTAACEGPVSPCPWRLPWVPFWSPSWRVLGSLWSGLASPRCRASGRASPHERVGVCVALVSVSFASHRASHLPLLLCFPIGQVTHQRPEHPGGRGRRRSVPRTQP